MFESKRVTREEQVLVIDDAELTGITSSGKDKGFVVNFVMEREGVERIFMCICLVLISKRSGMHRF